jgi:hypothetical protein
VPSPEEEVAAGDTTEVPFAEPAWVAAAPVAEPETLSDEARLQADVQGLRRQLEERQAEVEALDRDNAALRLETEWLRAELAKRGDR